MADNAKNHESSREQPTNSGKSKLKSEAEKNAGIKTKLIFDKQDPPIKGTLAKKETVTPSLKKPVGTAVSQTIHRKVAESNQDENAAVEAVDTSAAVTEAGVRALPNASHSQKLKSSENAEKYQAKADSSGANTAGQKQASESRESASNAPSRNQQKKAIQREYAASKRSGETATKSGNGLAKSFGQKATDLKDKAVSFASEHPYLLLFGGILVLLFLILCSSLSTCSALMPNGSGAVVVSTFTAKDTNIIGADNDYKALEAALETKISKTEKDKTGYDEYHYELDQIGHDPYKLAAYLTVLYEDYSRKEVQGTLKQLFEKQYQLTYSMTNETRYKTETRQGTREETIVTVVKEPRIIIDPETGIRRRIWVEVEKEQIIDVPYEYQVQVPYSYKTLTVSLKNKGLVYAISQLGTLTADQQERMSILAETKGNKEELFKDEAYVATGSTTNYKIPAEYLTDARFARMIKEAEKYLGYPYVWGGSSPDTSFDCSGFVSWVINHCGNGWSVGRQTAEGLRSQCVTIISASEAKPGDLIFFKGTYNTSGASHVGIYVGDNMMIHCGNPIQYASIDTPYMQEHFYCFGRIKD